MTKDIERDYAIYVSLCQGTGTPYVDFDTWAMRQGYEVESPEPAPTRADTRPPILKWADRLLSGPEMQKL